MAPPMQVADPSVCGVPLKYASLLILIVQNSFLVLVMRYSRVMDGPRYITSTAVLLSEAIKSVTCAFIHLRSTPQATWRGLLGDVVGRESGFTLLLVPAGLYSLQNNLQYVAASNLDAATFQVTYQLKILTTAVFSVIILRRELSRMKWIALLLLTAGVAAVQLPSSAAPAAAETASGGSRFVGLFSVGLACVLSGLAGVYFEKILKGTSASVWLRNIQLGIASSAFCLAGVLLWDGTAIAEHGFFHGYNYVTWMAIVTQALGGLIVAVVVKYADNILKGFSTSISIILSSIVSVFLFDFNISAAFVFGSTLVIYATYLYGLPDAKSTSQTGASGSAGKSATAALSEIKYKLAKNDSNGDLEHGAKN